MGGSETELIIGPMFSGKTSELFRRVKQHLVSAKRVALFTHGDDNRYSKQSLVSSHDGSVMKAIKIKSLTQINIAEDVSVIGIDEGQFFDGLSAFCLEQNRLGRTVIVAALNHEATADRRVWPNVVPLFGFSFVTLITAVCTICHAPALCSRNIQTNPLESIKNKNATFGELDSETKNQFKLFIKPFQNAFGQSIGIINLSREVKTDDEDLDMLLTQINEKQIIYLLDAITRMPSVINIGGNEKYIATCSACYTVPVPMDLIQKRVDAVRYIKEISN
jgi:thymidine kinase